SQAVARTGEEASGLGLPANDQAVAEGRDADQQEAGATAVAGGRLAEPAAEAAKTRTRPQREQLRDKKSGVQEPRVVLGFHDGRNSGWKKVEVVFGAGRIHAGMFGAGSGEADDGARRGGDSDVVGGAEWRARSDSFRQRAGVHRASGRAMAGCAESRAVVYCTGQSVGERLQRIVQQPDEGGVCGPGNVRLADGGEGFGSGIQAVLESGAVAQRDRIQDAGGIRRRTWAGLRYAPSAPSAITTPTDSQKHWYIKRGQATPSRVSSMGLARISSCSAGCLACPRLRSALKRLRLIASAIKKTPKTAVRSGSE